MHLLTRLRLEISFSISETKAKLDKYYSDSAPSYGMVQNLVFESRCGCTSLETITSPGRENEITTPEMINKMHDIVLNDPKVKVREIDEIVSISTGRVVNIFQNSGLNLVKVHQLAGRVMAKVFWDAYC